VKVLLQENEYRLAQSEYIYSILKWDYETNKWNLVKEYDVLRIAEEDYYNLLRGGS
jgi:hypothetical protein